MAEDVIARLARVEVEGGTAVLRRAWPRARGHLLLEYEGPHGELAAGQWLADRAELERVAVETAAAAAPGDVAVVGRPGSRIVLQRRGADRVLLALRDVMAQPGSALVSHRPERRALVRLSGQRYARVVRPDRCSRMFASLRTAERLAGGRFDVPPVLHADEAGGVAVTGALQGRSLHRLLAEDSALAAAAAVGRALFELHSAPALDVPRPHGPAEEAAVVSEWLDRASAHAARLAAPLHAEAAGVRAALSALPGCPAVPVHRDFHDKQCLVGPGGRVAMLDFDTVTQGDPAVDLANLLVHVELRSLQGRCTPERARLVAEAIVEAYEPDEGLASRLDAFADAARLRLACVYSFRPRWTELPCALLARLGQRATDCMTPSSVSAMRASE
ncbi:MAG TPA: phosphotransferase [Candidatus Limnocylindria bacterium]|nr:phosphotransferase [Candidatus Limnocylindria bacterium]